jgi:hypothetical protein
MRLLQSLFRRDPDDDTGDPLDIEHVLATGLRDARAARDALQHLAIERKRLARQRKVIDAQFKRLTPKRVRLIDQSSSGNPQSESFMLTHAMREADAANQQPRSDQLAEIESRMKAVDRAETELRAYLRRVG